MHAFPGAEKAEAASPDTDEAMDTEFLDLLQSADDANTLSALAQIDSAGSMGAETMAAPVTPLTQHENAFLVGGSLFTRGSVRQCAQRGSRNAPFTRRPSVLHTHTPRPMRRHAPVLLSLGSLFCPFTRQFFALRSPHWDQLRRVGFGMGYSMRTGRRVELIYPTLLLRAAQALQRVPADTIDSPVAPTSRCRGAPVWSPLLSRTLGSVLRQAPVGSLDAFKEYMHQHLETDAGVMQERQVPLSLATSRIACRHCEAPTRALADVVSTSAISSVAEQASSYECRTTSSRPTSPHSALFAVGQAWLRCAAADRSRQLQCPPLLPFEITTALTRTALSTAHTASVAQEPPLWSTTWPHMALPAPPQSWAGLPPHTRAAWLRLPICRHATMGGQASLMHSACASLILQQAQRTEGQDSTTLTHTVFFCPVEHTVDYNSVMDLVAHRVFPDASDPACTWLTRDTRSCAPHEAVPILSLGVSCSEELTYRRDHGDADIEQSSASTDASPHVLVIIGNAHLLSRRAVSRLLDQWTRNGAAQRLRDARHFERLRGREKHGQVARGPRRFSWHVLLGLDPFASPIRRRYMMPFGPVRALFVALEPDLSHDAPRSGATTDKPQRALLRVHIAPTPSHSVFHLKEPLSATLLRIGLVFRTHLDDEGRLTLLHRLVKCARAQLPGALVLVCRESVPTSASSPSGVRVTSARLDSADGARLFASGCEALLLTNTASTDGDNEVAVRLQSVEHTITSFPFLASITFSHRLVDAFPVHVDYECAASTGGHSSPASSASAPTSPTDVSRKTGTLSPLIVASRSEAHAREMQETTGRARQHRASGIARASSAEASRRSAPSDVLLTAANMRTNRSTYRTDEPRLYEGFIEPALLLGNWTRTHLFCAPIVADVLPLRAHLLARMRHWVRRRAPFRHSVRVVDVDIFHVDHVAFSLARRCRLFGVRAWFFESCGATAVRDAAQQCRPGTSRKTRVFLDELLQAALHEYAADPVFFPLWTYTDGPQGVEEQPQREHIITESDVCASTSTAGSSYSFRSVPEWRTPATPVAVERRLFAMAAVQYPALQLAHGSRIVLHSPVQGPLSAQLPAGTVCVVTDFAPPTTTESTHERRAAVHLRSGRPVDDVRAALYLQQQRSGVLDLPVLKPIFVPYSPYAMDGRFMRVAEQDSAGFLLLPQPLLVGGYRSLHYYSLPLLHLPCHVLAGGDAGVRTALRFNKQRASPDALLDVANPEDVSFAFPGPFLFHPYYGSRSCKSQLCLTPTHRHTIFSSVLFNMRPSASSALSAPVFFEDAFLSSSSTEPLAGTHRAAASRDESASTAESPPPPLQLLLNPSLPQDARDDDTAALSDPLITELALFHPSPT